MDDHRNQDERKPLGREYVVDPDRLVFIAESERKLENIRPVVRQCHARRRMHAARIAKHVHKNPEEKARREQAIFVAVHGIQNNEQHVRIRIDVTQEVDIVENEDLGRKQQNKTGDIDQYGAIHLFSSIVFRG